MNIALGKTGFSLAAIASTYNSVQETYDSNELRAEVDLTRTTAKEDFAKLEAQKSAIELELGEPLSWQALPDAKMCRICFRRSAKLSDRDTWPECHRWLVEKLDALHQAFAMRVKILDAGEQPVELLESSPQA